MTRRSAGMTLIELMVVLAVLGVMATVTVLAWKPRAPDSTTAKERGERSITAVRRRAVESGKVVIDSVLIGERLVQVITFPDGRLMGAERFGVNPFTGEVRDAKASVP